MTNLAGMMESLEKAAERRGLTVARHKSAKGEYVVRNPARGTAVTGADVAETWEIIKRTPILRSKEWSREALKRGAEKARGGGAAMSAAWTTAPIHGCQAANSSPTILQIRVSHSPQRAPAGPSIALTRQSPSVFPPLRRFTHASRSCTHSRTCCSQVSGDVV